MCNELNASNRAGNIVLSILRDVGLSQAKFSSLIGEDRRLLFAQLKKNDDLRVERLEDLLEYLGYRLEVREEPGFRRINPDVEKIDEIDGEVVWFKNKDGSYSAYDRRDGSNKVEKFRMKEEMLNHLRNEMEADSRN